MCPFLPFEQLFIILIEPEKLRTTGKLFLGERTLFVTYKLDIYLTGVWDKE